MKKFASLIHLLPPAGLFVLFCIQIWKGDYTYGILGYYIIIGIGMVLALLSTIKEYHSREKLSEKKVRLSVNLIADYLWTMAWILWLGADTPVYVWLGLMSIYAVLSIWAHAKRKGSPIFFKSLNPAYDGAGTMLFLFGILYGAWCIYKIKLS